MNSNNIVNFQGYTTILNACTKKVWKLIERNVPIVIGALGTVTKGLVQEMKDLEITGLVETIQTTALLRSARILKGVLET